MILLTLCNWLFISALAGGIPPNRYVSGLVTGIEYVGRGPCRLWSENPLEVMPQTLYFVAKSPHCQYPSRAFSRSRCLIHRRRFRGRTTDFVFHGPNIRLYDLTYHELEFQLPSTRSYRACGCVGVCGCGGDCRRKWNAQSGLFSNTCLTAAQPRRPAVAAINSKTII